MYLYTKRSVDIHFVRTCIITFILTFTFSNQSVSKKKIVKVIEDKIYGKLLEIYKGTKKVVLVIFVEAIPFSGSHLFQWKVLLLVETIFFFAETISFSGRHFFQWRPYFLVESISFNGSRFFQCKPLLSVETNSFSGSHSFC